MWWIIGPHLLSQKKCYIWTYHLNYSQREAGWGMDSPPIILEQKQLLNFSVSHMSFLTVLAIMTLVEEFPLEILKLPSKLVGFFYPVHSPVDLLGVSSSRCLK